MKPGHVELRRAADRIQDVRRERQVQHLLEEDAVDHLDGLRVVSVLDRVQRAEVGRERRVLELDRPLQVLRRSSIVRIAMRKTLLGRRKPWRLRIAERWGRPVRAAWRRSYRILLKPSRRRLGLVAIVVTTAMITRTA